MGHNLLGDLQLSTFGIKKMHIVLIVSPNVLCFLLCSIRSTTLSQGLVRERWGCLNYASYMLLFFNYREGKYMELNEVNILKKLNKKALAFIVTRHG